MCRLVKKEKKIVCEKSCVVVTSSGAADPGERKKLAKNIITF